jgi:hypothetical protein
MRFLCLLLLVFLPLFLFTPLYAHVIHVPGDSTTIQGGIVGASTGDTVMVAPGTYNEYDIDFLGKAITVMGTDPEDSAVVAATIVDANALGRVFKINSSEISSSILTGLTITGGSNSPFGGGVFCGNSSPTITHNIIRGNESLEGGGIDCFFSEAIITDNLILDNSAGFGGGINCTSAAPVITNNRIVGNSGEGAGIYCDNSDAVITGNTIIGNTSDNVAGIYCYYSDAYIVNTVIADNTGSNLGYALFLSFSDAQIIHTTITANSDGGLWCENSTPTITNTVVWGNIGWDFEVQGGDPAVSYSNIGLGGYPGVGVIDADPHFVDPGNDNYHLSSISPCIDSGTDAGYYDDFEGDVRPVGNGFDMGYDETPHSVPFNLTLTPTSPVEVPKGGDLLFNSLIQNNTENTGAGDFWLVVMLPNTAQVLIPEGLLNIPNPQSGVVPANSFYNLDVELFVPAFADTGSYLMIGRIGNYPNTIFDASSFEFQVVE